MCSSTLNIDYHVAIDHNFYSVPYPLIDESLEARFTASTIEVFFKSRRVAAHAHLTGRGRYATRLEHMPRALTTGGCYRAANWIAVGETAGRGRDDHRHARHGVHPQRIFVYPLVRDARTRLRGEAVRL